MTDAYKRHARDCELMRRGGSLQCSCGAMTDAKPVEVGELIARLNHVRRIVGNMCSELRPPKMSIPARPDCDEDFIISATVKDSQAALLALQAEIARLRKWKKQILIAAGAQENDDVAKWICNSDAEVARLTQENALLAGEVANWRKKYGNDKPWDSPPVRTPIPTAIITKARRDEQ